MPDGLQRVELCSFVAGEVKNPQRNLPGSLALAMGAVIVLYVSANIAYMT